MGIGLFLGSSAVSVVSKARGVTRAGRGTLGFGRAKGDAHARHRCRILLTRRPAAKEEANQPTMFGVLDRVARRLVRTFVGGTDGLTRREVVEGHQVAATVWTEAKLRVRDGQ